MLRCIRDFWITERRDCCERRSHASPLLPVRIPRIVPLYYRPDLPVLRMEEVQSFLADAAILRTPQPACVASVRAAVELRLIMKSITRISGPANGNLEKRARNRSCGIIRAVCANVRVIIPGTH